MEMSWRSRSDCHCLQDFLEEWKDEVGDGPKYLQGAKDLIQTEKNTLQVTRLKMVILLP